MPRKVSRRNTKKTVGHNTKTKSHKLSKKLSKKSSRMKRLSKKSSRVKRLSKKLSASSKKRFTGRKLLPRRAIIFPDPIMDGGGVDREMLGL